MEKKFQLKEINFFILILISIIKNLKLSYIMFLSEIIRKLKQ